MLDGRLQITRFVQIELILIKPVVYHCLRLLLAHEIWLKSALLDLILQFLQFKFLYAHLLLPCLGNAPITQFVKWKLALFLQPPVHFVI